MMLNNKQKEADYRKADILINPYMRSLSENIGAPSKEGRQLRWIMLLLIVMFVIAVINIVAKIY